MADTDTLSETPATDLPRREAKPLLAWFLWAHQIKLRPAAAAIGDVSHEQVRLFCLPFDDPKRVVPDGETARRIAAWTKNVVAPWMFDDTPGARAIGLSGVTTQGSAP